MNVTIEQLQFEKETGRVLSERAAMILDLHSQLQEAQQKNQKLEEKIKELESKESDSK